MNDKCWRACRREFVFNATGKCRDGVCMCYYCTNIPPRCSNGTNSSTNATTNEQN
jgi:hypothetical protein